VGMINLSRVVAGILLPESYTIQRNAGAFVAGGWKIVGSVNVQGYGVVSVAKDQDLLMLPEGDRVTGAMVFHSEQRIYETQLDGGFNQQAYGAGGFGSTKQHLSDIILWNSLQYRVLLVAPYPNRAYWRAVAVRMAGQ
jgi:hypothetical protein